MSGPMDPEPPAERHVGWQVEADSETAPALAVHSTEEIARYSRFYRMAVPRLTAYLLCAEGASKAEASECAHEALVHLLHRWSEVERPLSWCRKAARSIFLKRVYSATDSFGDIPATGAPLYRDDHEGVEQRRQVLSLIGALPPRQRRTTTLLLEGYSVDEIAAELEIASATVRSNLRHARTRLVTLFDQGETRGEDR